MSYNWEKFFKKKSTKELYEVYTGRSTAHSESVIPYAEKELKYRNFNFENKEGNQQAWHLSCLLSEEKDYLSTSILRAIEKSPLYIVLAFAISFTSFLSIIPKQYFYLWFSFLVVLTIYSFYAGSRKQMKTKKITDMRQSEIKQLTLKLKKEGLLKSNGAWYRDIISAKAKNEKDAKVMNYLIAGLAFVAILYEMMSYFHWW